MSAKAILIKLAGTCKKCGEKSVETDNGVECGCGVKVGGMAFLKQDRPKKVKEIYSALKRDHPDMPAEMKARIAARQGKRGKQKQGPPYKGPLTKEAAKEKLGHALNLLWAVYGTPDGVEKNAAAIYFEGIRQETRNLEALGEEFCKVASRVSKDPWELAAEVEARLPAFQKLAWIASDPQAQALARFYVGWADEVMEKEAGLLSLIGRGAAGLARGGGAVGRGLARGARATVTAPVRGARAAVRGARAAPAQMRAGYQQSMARAKMKATAAATKKELVKKRLGAFQQAGKRTPQGALTPRDIAPRPLPGAATPAPAAATKAAPRTAPTKTAPKTAPAEGAAAEGAAVKGKLPEWMTNPVNVGIGGAAVALPVGLAMTSGGGTPQPQGGYYQ